MLQAAAAIAIINGERGAYQCYNISRPMTGGIPDIAIESNAAAFAFCDAACSADPNACVAKLVDMSAVTLGSVSKPPSGKITWKCASNFDNYGDADDQGCGVWTSFCDCHPCVAKRAGGRSTQECNAHWLSTVKVGQSPDGDFDTDCCCDGVGACTDELYPAAFTAEACNSTRMARGTNPDHRV